MSTNLLNRGCRAVLALFLFLSLTPVDLPAARKAKKGGDFDLTGIVRPDLVNAQTDPTLRFAVMNTGRSIFSITYGWFDISRSTVRYTVVQPPSKSNHTFTASRLAINDVRYNREWLMFRADKKEKMLIYLPQDRWGTVHSGPGMGSAANRESLGTSSIYKTLMNFDGVLALVKPAPPPAPVIIAQPVAP